ncbi:MAG: MFS transporter [Deltaproteobacteria bacterium]|nr:MFS transporter [Deltaproteobacteria bacterium]
MTVGLLLGTFLAALELNVVGTAMPTLVAQLGGLELYGLVFSAYLLTSTVTIPLYGRLADLHGRRPVYLVAIALFLLGSGLCGAAWSMVPLIAFRALQGLGAGGLIPITITLFGDLFPAERRALVQGLFSTVWGVSSVLGPLIGGFLVTYVSWRWVFWFNIPAGLLAALLVAIALHERPAHDGPGGLDLAGTLLLIGGLVCLLVGLQGIESRAPWSYPALGGALLLGLGFAWHERRSERPVLPLSLFRQQAMLVTGVGGLAVGGLLFSLVTFIPLFVQGVLHGSPTRAGLALVPLSLVWTTATFATGPLSRRVGYRPVVVLGGLLAAVGAATLLAVPREGSPLVRHLAMVSIGAAMGLIITASTIAVQDTMPWHRRGVATALIQFTRTVGGMVAVTLLGALVTARFADGMGRHLPPGATPSELLDPGRWERFDRATLDRARGALAGAIHGAFLVLAGLGGAILLVHLAFPPLRVENRPDGDTQSQR